MLLSMVNRQGLSCQRWQVRVFFHHHLVLYTLSPPTITTLLTMSMSPFSFLLNPATPGEGFKEGLLSLTQCLGAKFPTYLADHVLHVFSMLQGCGLVSSMMVGSLFGGKFNI